MIYAMSVPTAAILAVVNEWQNASVLREPQTISGMQIDEDVAHIDLVAGPTPETPSVSTAGAVSMATSPVSTRTAIRNLLLAGDAPRPLAIAQQLGVSESTVYGHMKALREAGEIPQPFRGNGSADRAG